MTDLTERPMEDLDPDAPIETQIKQVNERISALLARVVVLSDLVLLQDKKLKVIREMVLGNTNEADMGDAQ